MRKRNKAITIRLTERESQRKEKRAFGLYVGELRDHISSSKTEDRSG